MSADLYAREANRLAARVGFLEETVAFLQDKIERLEKK